MRPQLRRGVRAVEGARLESECRGNSTVGSNPTLSATSIISAYLQCMVSIVVSALIHGRCIYRLRRAPDMSKRGNGYGGYRLKQYSRSHSQGHSGSTPRSYQRDF